MSKASKAFDWYDVVRVKATAVGPAARFAGDQGPVLGISDDEKPAYAVLLDEYGRVVSFDADQLEWTGRRMSRSEIYG